MTRIQSQHDACTCVYVSLLKGTALVVAQNGGTYAYSNGHACHAQSHAQPNMSLGMWVKELF